MFRSIQISSIQTFTGGQQVLRRTTQLYSILYIIYSHKKINKSMQFTQKYCVYLYLLFYPVFIYLYIYLFIYLWRFRCSELLLFQLFITNVSIWLLLKCSYYINPYVNTKGAVEL